MKVTSHDTAPSQGPYAEAWWSSGLVGNVVRQPPTVPVTQLCGEVSRALEKLLGLQPWGPLRDLRLTDSLRSEAEDNGKGVWAGVRAKARASSLDTPFPCPTPHTCAVTIASGEQGAPEAGGRL